MNQPRVFVYILYNIVVICFFFSSRRRHTRFDCDWSSDVCSSDLPIAQDAQGSIGPFSPSICRIDWQTITSAPSGALPPVTACPYCGRANDPGAQFCMDCGKPMGKFTGRKTAEASPGGGGRSEEHTSEL